MTIEEIKVGTKFTYVGEHAPKENLLIQTVDKIQQGYITSKFVIDELHENCFGINSQYMKDCKIIQPPSDDTMKRYFVYKGITFIIKVKILDDEKLPMYVITINEVNGTFEYVAYLLDADIPMLTEHITKLENKAMTYVNTTYPSQVDQIKQYLKESGFSEE